MATANAIRCWLSISAEYTGKKSPEIWCRGGAVSCVECRSGCRDMPLYAAICRSLERKSLIFLGFVFSCQRGGRRFAAELRSASAKRAKPASEPGLVLQKK